MDCATLEKPRLEYCREFKVDLDLNPADVSGERTT